MSSSCLWYLLGPVTLWDDGTPFSCSISKGVAPLSVSQDTIYIIHDNNALSMASLAIFSLCFQYGVPSRLKGTIIYLFLMRWLSSNRRQGFLSLFFLRLLFRQYLLFTPLLDFSCLGFAIPLLQLKDVDFKLSEKWLNEDSSLGLGAKGVSGVHGGRSFQGSLRTSGVWGLIITVSVLSWPIS